MRSRKRNILLIVLGAVAFAVGLVVIFSGSSWGIILGPMGASLITMGISSLARNPNTKT